MSKIEISSNFNPQSDLSLFHGEALNLLSQMPDNFVKLIITSPPYNLGKSYEKKLELNEYLDQQKKVIHECYRVLEGSGSICWQVGNFVDNGEIIPLDIVLFPIFQELGLQLRNRIVWQFGHGLHASKRFSGRYEVILWFTKSHDYTFNLDAVRIPQKYPAKKHFKGPKKGELSGNPLGKNPSDVWNIPNVKANHVEKTIHPCQFPVELVERLVLALTNPGDFVFDPYIGVGTSAIAALMHNRKAIGSEIMGLEALSRGARHCVFVEGDPKVCAVLRANIAALDYDEQSRVVDTGYVRALKTLVQTVPGFDLLFLDPPYRMLAEVEATVTPLLPFLLSHDGVVVAEGDRATVVTFGRDPVFERTYGDTKVVMVRTRRATP